MSDISFIDTREPKENRERVEDYIKKIYNESDKYTEDENILWDMGEQQFDSSALDVTYFSEDIFISNIYREQTVLPKEFLEIAELCYEVMIKTTYGEVSKTLLMFQIVCHLLKEGHLEGYWFNDKKIVNINHPGFDPKKHIDPTFGLITSFNGGFRERILDKMYDRVFFAAHWIKDS